MKAHFFMIEIIIIEVLGLHIQDYASYELFA
jgi:hypothetical protein